ncbi:MAG: CoA transferase [Deferrisomatales bacterium]|nr:CoA transferase [Deferrisomatales bacterium]
MSGWTRTPGLLAGVRLLDLTDAGASFCGSLLADLGAEVVKAELPGEGAPVPAACSPRCASSGNSERCPGPERDRLQVRDRLLRLAAQTDVVLEGLAPGGLERWGLGYETLAALDPRLVFASVSGFGSSGPKRTWTSCDLVAAAAGGQLFLNGLRSREPLKLAGFQALHLGSLHAAVGVVLALIARNASGRGNRVEVSLQEAVASGLDHALVRYFADGTVAERNGSRYWNDAFFVVPCADGYLQIYPFEQWETLVEWMGTEGMAGDLAEPRYLDPRYRRENFALIAEAVSRWTATHTRAELCETAQLMRFPWAPVCDLAEVLASPQLAARSFFDTAPGCIRAPRSPYRFRTRETHRSSSGKPLPPQPGSRRAPVQSGILSGLRVLDFTRVLAGPYATRLLADFGAEVIKVQSERTDGAGANDQPYFAAWNRNKRSISLDMGRTETREVVLELVRNCDVVVENFAPRVFDNWGLDYETLCRANEAVILLRMSGVGQSGPWRNAVAFGPTIHGAAGLAQLTSYPGGPPLGPGFAYADVASGLYGALALAAAVYSRDRTGRGQCIDLSEYEAVVSLLGPGLQACAGGEGEGGIREALQEPSRAAPYGCFRCGGEDRWCALAVFDEAQWAALCEVLDLPEAKGQPRFAGVEARRLHADELRGALEERTCQREAAELAESLQARGVPASAVQDASDLACDPQLTGRGFFECTEHPVLGACTTERGAIRLGSDTRPPLGPAPRLGQDNAYVFGELLGWPAEKIALLRDRGVIK